MGLSACPAAQPVGNCFKKRRFHPPLLARRGVLCTGWRISFMADVCGHCCQVQCQIFFSVGSPSTKGQMLWSHIAFRIHDGTNSSHYSRRGDLRHGPRGACPHILARSPCAVSTVQERSTSCEEEKRKHACIQ